MKQLFASLSLMVVLSVCTHAQGNLIPNGSFETYSTCPSTGSQIHLATPWVTPTTGSPEYFNTCSNGNQIAPPSVIYGYQFPHSGDGFVGMYCFAYGQPQGREYIQVALTEPIHAGVRYKVSFYVSLADLSIYAVSSLGAYLSQDAISLNEYWLLDVVPQVLNPAGNIITDTAGWVLVTDTFASRIGGGERFLTIGNFNYADVSDTLLYNPTGDPNYSFAYYYIDDVSVVALDTLSGIEETEQLSFSIYPNPAKEFIQFKVEGATWQPSSAIVLDAVGRVLRYTTTLGRGGTQDDHTIDLSDLPSGIYFLQLTDKQGKYAVSKFVKE